MSETQAKDTLIYLILKFVSVVSPQRRSIIEHINYEKRLIYDILDEAQMNLKEREKIIE